MIDKYSQPHDETQQNSAERKPKSMATLSAPFLAPLNRPLALQSRLNSRPGTPALSSAKRPLPTTQKRLPVAPPSRPSPQHFPRQVCN